MRIGAKLYHIRFGMWLGTRRDALTLCAIDSISQYGASVLELRLAMNDNTHDAANQAARLCIQG
jgi:hypothetical protein